MIAPYCAVSAGARLASHAVKTDSGKPFLRLPIIWRLGKSPAFSKRKIVDLQQDVRAKISLVGTKRSGVIAVDGFWFVAINLIP